MDQRERPEPPLTARRKMLVGIGAGMFVLQLATAVALAPMITGAGDANAGALGGLWAAAIPWSAAAVLLLVRQVDMPDIATASMLVTVSSFAAFALTAALDARGTDAETNVVDALFLGVTTGALTALIVWGLAMSAARVLKLPRA